MAANSSSSDFVTTLKDITAIAAPLISIVLTYIVFRFTKTMKERDINQAARQDLENCIDKLLEIQKERATLALERPEDLGALTVVHLNYVFNRRRSYYVNHAVEVLNRHRIRLYSREKLVLSDELFKEGRQELAIEYLNDIVSRSGSDYLLKSEALKSLGWKLYDLGQRKIGVEAIHESINVLQNSSTAAPGMNERIDYSIAETYCALSDASANEGQSADSERYLESAKEYAARVRTRIERERIDAMIKKVTSQR